MAHLEHAVPNATFRYVMDNALLPYGLQSQETIIKRLSGLVKPNQPWSESIDLIVIACNTASTQALDALRKMTTIPIVGVVPAIKPAALQSKTRHIALLATPATTSNQYTHNLIREFASDCQVDLHHSTDLVRLAEACFWQNTTNETEIIREIQRLSISPYVDQLVLGCTHFPIIARQIKSALGAQVSLLDSGAAIARRVMHLLGSSGKQICVNKKGLVYYYATKPIVHSNNSITDVLNIDLS
ncbi:Glutamate racemase [Pseudoalteromonas luteoviolacea B = ATCC 29581]|nr:Glutamate racemase [Pseudoalteromonas luteoviolacea B = ATCC 29581]